MPEIDQYHLNAVKIASGMKKPILGICRGLQILNVAFGGTLYQDLSLIPGCYIKHFQRSKIHVASHNIDVEASTELPTAFTIRQSRI
jgi:putative glutamine amidotransferase